MTIRIPVVDEHCVVRTGLCAFLNFRPGLQVVDGVGDLGVALGKAPLLHPDLVLTEICTSVGLDLGKIAPLKSLGLALRVLVLSASRDPGLARAALRVGADGYIVKHASALELLSAIRAVVHGQFLCPSLPDS